MEINISDILKSILSYSTEEAMRLGNGYVGLEHVVLGMIRHENNRAVEIMRSLGADTAAVKKGIEAKTAVQRTEEYSPDPNRQIPVNGQMELMVRVMYLESLRLKSEKVEPEHALLAILKNASSAAAGILGSQGVSFDKVNGLLQPAAAPSNPGNVRDSEEDIGMFDYGDARENRGGRRDRSGKDDASKSSDAASAASGSGSGNGSGKNSKTGTPVLDNFGHDLTKAAREHALDPVVGREMELDRIIQILSRRKKNNPVLIGEPGVGKSSIAEGLAQRIADNKVPRLLRNKRVLTLDIASVVAGTKYRGQFEERMKAIINELQKHPEVIVFIDEIHTMVGAGNSAGALDASNMFKPALARGEIQCIGATTLDEFRGSIEKDGALERRFQKVLVEPTTAEETLEILHNVKVRYEDHHLVRYTEGALKACVELTDRYITERVLPDKAIDALDEAGAKVHLGDCGVPAEISDTEDKLAAARKGMMDAIQGQRFEEASKLRTEVGELEAKLKEINDEWNRNQEANRPEVTEEDVTKVVAMMSGVPIEKVAQNEMTQLLDMGDILKRKVIGQDEAIDKIVRAIRRNRTGLKDPGRPIGSFIFLGPTGVGKTYLTKSLAECMFNSESALIRIDMSEYMEKFDVSRLIGSPPGYVGYEDGGQLTEKVRRKPYSIVLFDEIEKAHPDIFNLLLQVLDEGRLTDGLGRKVDFKNAIIIMTSNLGSRQLKEFGAGIGFSTAAREDAREKIAKSVVDKELKKKFAPEFLNRIDEIIVFHNLEKKDIFRIIDTEFVKLQRRMEKQGATMELTEAAKEFLMEKGWDPDLGARPLKRCMEHYIDDEIAEQMIRGLELEGKRIVIDCVDKTSDKLEIKID